MTMSRTTAAHRRSLGFTLIEVLVVVAIIALLVSILLPSLAAARAQARIVVCATNLKTIGTATVYYAQANKDDMPTGYQTDEDGVVVTQNGVPALSGNPWEFLYPYVIKAGARKGENITSSSGWVVNIPVYKCPDDLKNHTSNQRALPTSDGLQPAEIALSYGANNNLLWKVHNDRFKGTWKRDSIKRASSVVVYNDAGDDEKNGADGWYLLDCMASNHPYNQCFFELRHNKSGNNFAYLDTHVEFKKFNPHPPQYGLPPFPIAWIPNYTTPGEYDNWIRPAPHTKSPLAP